MLRRRKPTTCKCPGKSYRDKWDRWKVIERHDDKPCVLKCNRCGWVWRSRRRYVELVPDGKVRKFGKLTDAEVLEMIADGRLCVDISRAIVVSRLPGRSRCQLAIVERTSHQSTYRFVKITSNGKQKKVALHRLVWMAANMRLPPRGWHVDHIESQTDDTIGNLRVLPSAVNEGHGRARDEWNDW